MSALCFILYDRETIHGAAMETRVFAASSRNDDVNLLRAATNSRVIIIAVQRRALQSVRD